MVTCIRSSFKESSGAFWSWRFLWPRIRGLIGLLDVLGCSAVEAFLLSCQLGLANVSRGHGICKPLSALLGVADAGLRLAVSGDVFALAAVFVVTVVV